MSLEIVVLDRCSDRLSLTNRYSQFSISVLPTYTSYVKLIPTEGRVPEEKSFQPFLTTVHECLLYYHSVSVLSSAITEKECPLRTYYVQGTYIGVACQAVHNAWSLLATKCGHDFISTMIAPYVFYDLTLGCFMVLEKRSDSYAPVSQRTSFEDSDVPSTNRADVDPIAIDRSDAEDCSYRLIATLMFSTLQAIVSSIEFFSTIKTEGGLMKFDLMKTCKLNITNLIHQCRKDYITWYQLVQHSNLQENVDRPSFQFTMTSLRRYF